MPRHFACAFGVRRIAHPAFGEKDDAAIGHFFSEHDLFCEALAVEICGLERTGHLGAGQHKNGIRKLRREGILLIKDGAQTYGGERAQSEHKKSDYPDDETETAAGANFQSDEHHPRAVPWLNPPA